MPRSSRHKSSKHSSRDAREYSDSEKESSLRERKSKDESSARALKESGDKRKLDSKDNKEYYDSLNGEYYEEYTSSKRHKEKTEDGVNDRWNGGDEDRGESSKKSKTSSEKSRRREEVDVEATKKSSSKTDGKHRESSRKESREIEKEKGRDRDRDRDRKHKEGKAEKFHDGEDHYGSKVVSDKTDVNAQDQLRSPGAENYPEKRARRKRDDYGDRDKHQGSFDDASERLLGSGDDNNKDGRQREEKYRDKSREDIEEEKQQFDKPKDDRAVKEHSRSDDKLFRDEKETSESKRKKSKFQDNDHEHGQERGHEPESEHDGHRNRSRDDERTRDYDREYDRGRDRGRERDQDRDRARERERARDRRDNEHRYHERDLDHDRSRDRDWDNDRDRTRDREKDRSRDYYDRERSKSERVRDFDRDAPHLDDQSGRHKDSKERRRSPDDHDGLSDNKSRNVAAHADMEIRSSRAQLDSERIKSHSRQPSNSHGGQDDIRHILDQRLKAISSRDAADLSGGSERGSMYRASEKTAKIEDGPLGELSVEKSSSAKASPRGLMEKSPSSTSLERRYVNRSGTRRSLEVEETGQRSAYEDRLSRDLPPEKPLGDDSLQADLSFSSKVHQSNSPFPPRPESRGGIGSPIVGSLEDDNRFNIGGRFKRGGDMNMGRGQGSAWRGAPNWPSPVPNGFIPFPHGPPHGGFQPMMPQFPSPSLFGVRPSMEMSHSGIPYHMPDAERFSGHLRPLGWPNMMDGSGPSHMHGWDMSNGVFRDEPHMYGGAEWDHSRRMHSRGWECGTDAWKAQNGDVNMDVSLMSQKDDQSGQAVDEDALAGQTSHHDNNRAKSVEAGSNQTSPAKDLLMDSCKILVEETSDHPVVESTDNAEYYCRYYLSKLDISVELVDAELHSECMSFLRDGESPIVDDTTAFVINLKDEGKALLKSDCTTLSAFSLFPSANSSVFQAAMDMYKEQRVEMKGIPPITNEDPQVCPVANPDKVRAGDYMDDAKEEESSIKASDAEASPEKAEATLSGDAAETDRHDGNSSQAHEDTMDLDHNEGSLQEAKKTDCVGVDGVELSAAEGSDMAEKERTGKLEREEDEELSGDDVNEKVGGELVPETRESDESVISRIHHSPQITH